MATNTMVPYSNPAGNNQTTPGAGAQPNPIAIPQMNPLQPIGTTGTGGNPFIPSVPIAAPATPLTSGTTGIPVSVPGAGGTSTNATNSDKQLTDIYGKGVGGDLNNLLNSIGGTDSATLQEFAQSLVPQEAQAQANLNASLGAGGVSANSSVAALGNANLQAQETGAIAGEEAQLTQSGQNLEASILTGMEPSAEQEVSESGWNVFGDVMSQVGKDAGSIISAGSGAGWW